MKNLSASIRARLRNSARQHGQDFNRLSLLFFQERFLARLSRSSHAKHFVLKGGLYLYARFGQAARPTKDMDVLARGIPSDLETIAKIIREVLEVTLPDGVQFNPQSVTASRIKEGAEYEGVRVNFEGHLDGMRQVLQVDVGFGDVVNPAPQVFDFPVILEDLSVPHLRAYSLETVIAEKFQAMTMLGENNSRAKDFYDIWYASQHQAFDATTLRRTIQATFQHRQTPLEYSQSLFTPEFANGSYVQQAWAAFRKNNPHLTAPESLALLLERVQSFLEPLLQGDTAGRWNPVFVRWEATGPGA
jgi:predicted nucleotidyltransferase component of viral defense system